MSKPNLSQVFENSVRAIVVMVDGVRRASINSTGKDIDLLCSIMNGIILCSKVLTGYAPTLLDFGDVKVVLHIGMESPQVAAWAILEGHKDPENARKILADYMDRYLARRFEGND